MPAAPNPDDETPRRAPRRDAIRNDQLVLDAARAVFAEHGPQAPIEDVAARAGLGVGSIYRRFRGKDALLAAIAQQLVQDLDAAAARALAEDDPGRGLEGFLEYVGGFNAEKRRYAGALLEHVDDDVSAGTDRKVRELTRKAVDAGYLAPDVRAADIRALIVALRAVDEGDGGDWRRFLHIHLEGLRQGPHRTNRN
jgi:AcrR family transcriptional regulator